MIACCSMSVTAEAAVVLPAKKRAVPVKTYDIATSDTLNFVFTGLFAHGPLVGNANAETSTEASTKASTDDAQEEDDVSVIDMSEFSEEESVNEDALNEEIRQDFDGMSGIVNAWSHETFTCWHAPLSEEASSDMLQEEEDGDTTASEPTVLKKRLLSLMDLEAIQEDLAGMQRMLRRVKQRCDTLKRHLVLGQHAQEREEEQACLRRAAEFFPQEVPPESELYSKLLARTDTKDRGKSPTMWMCSGADSDTGVCHHGGNKAVCYAGSRKANIARHIHKVHRTSLQSVRLVGKQGQEKRLNGYDCEELKKWLVTAQDPIEYY